MLGAEGQLHRRTSEPPLPNRISRSRQWQRVADAGRMSCAWVCTLARQFCSSLAAIPHITALTLADVIVEQAGKNGNRSLSVSKLFAELLRSPIDLQRLTAKPIL